MASLLEHKSQIAFLMDEIFNQARLAGVNIQSVVGPAATDPTAVFRWGMAAEASAVGQSAGVLMGEAFHYERFHPLIEGVLQGAFSQLE